MGTGRHLRRPPCDSLRRWLGPAQQASFAPGTA